METKRRERRMIDRYTSVVKFERWGIVGSRRNCDLIMVDDKRAAVMPGFLRGDIATQVHVCYCLLLQLIIS